MKRISKLVISLVIVGALFVGSSAISIESGASPKSKLSDRLEQAFAKVKRELISYSECLKTQNCTKKQKLATVVALGAMLTLAAVGGLAYKKYAERPEPVFADGGTLPEFTEKELLPSLHRYIKDVRKNLFSEKLKEITYTMPANLKKYSKQIINTSKDELNKLLQNIQTVLQSGGEAKDFYDDLKGTYVANFGELLVHTFGIQYDKVYEFLGTTPTEGKAMILPGIKKLIAKKLHALRLEKKYQQEMFASLDRQLGYIFRNEQQKKEYDAFLGGEKEVAKIVKQVSDNVKDMQENKLQEIVNIVSALS